jgi:hypothetical protein
VLPACPPPGAGEGIAHGGLDEEGVQGAHPSGRHRCGPLH